MWADSHKIVQERLKKSGRNPDRWELATTIVDDQVHIYAIKGLQIYLYEGHWYVSSPNIFERLLGITLDDKMKRAYGKAEKYTNKLNTKEDDLKQALEGLKEK